MFCPKDRFCVLMLKAVEDQQSDEECVIVISQSVENRNNKNIGTWV